MTARPSIAGMFVFIYFCLKVALIPIFLLIPNVQFCDYVFYIILSTLNIMLNYCFFSLESIILIVLAIYY